MKFRLGHVSGTLHILYFRKSHNTVHLGGGGGGWLFVLKQWISSSLKHGTVQRVNNLYCFYVKNPPKRIALWEWENSLFVLNPFTSNKASDMLRLLSTLKGVFRKITLARVVFKETQENYIPLER